MTNTAIVYLPLDDFLMQFYYGAFPQPPRVPNFQFPRNHDLELAIQYGLKPSDEEPEAIGFRVQVSLPEHLRESDYYTFTKKSLAIVMRRMRTYYALIAHDFLSQRRKDGFEIKECIELFLLKYNIEDTEKNYERVKKDFDRWRNRQAVRKYRKKIKKINTDCPSCT